MSTAYAARNFAYLFVVSSRKHSDVAKKAKCTEEKSYGV